MSKPAQPQPLPFDPEGSLADARASMERLSAWVPIRALSRRHKAKVSQHLLALNSHDRYLRFGFAASDADVAHYVRRIDFEADEVLGIFNHRLELIGLAHLAPCGPMVGDFGVSVLAHARGRRLGRRLFDAASLHARNRGIDTLIIQALAINQPMLNIARAAGAEIEYFGADAEARVRLPADNVSSHIAELVEQNLAEWDLQMKRQARLLEDWVEGWRLGP